MPGGRIATLNQGVLEKLAIEPSGSSGLFGMTDMTRDKSMSTDGFEAEHDGRL